MCDCGTSFVSSSYLCAEQSKNRSYSEWEESLGVKEQLFPWCQPLILQMKLLELTEGLQAIHHCNPVSTQIPTEQEQPHTCSHTVDFEWLSQHGTTINQSCLLTVWRASADWRDYLSDWCCCSACTDGWGWRQNPGCKCVWSDYRTGKGQWGFYTWRDHPEKQNLKKWGFEEERGNQNTSVN